MSDYWDECVSTALEEAGVSATKEQIKSIAADIVIGYEMYGMAHGYECIPDPRVAEVAALKAKLRTEESKQVCHNCQGKGYLVSYGGTCQTESRCSVCGGEGKV